MLMGDSEILKWGGLEGSLTPEEENGALDSSPSISPALRHKVNRLPLLTFSSYAVGPQAMESVSQS